MGLPNQTLPRTAFAVVTLDAGMRALRVQSEASYGGLFHAWAGSAASHISWHWRLDLPNAQADLTRKHSDDAALKVCALFDLPLEAVPFWERQALRLARMASGELLPASTVCYVWDARLPPGSTVDNVYTRRVRQIVLRGPEAAARRWFVEQRDLRQDFLRLFGDETQAVPALLGILVGADADNTGSRSLGYLAELQLK